MNGQILVRVCEHGRADSFAVMDEEYLPCRTSHMVFFPTRVSLAELAQDRIRGALEHGGLAFRASRAEMVPTPTLLRELWLHLAQLLA